MRMIVKVCLLLAAAGCAPAPYLEPHSIEARPVPFPQPGVYTGAMRGGAVTYRIAADGRGLGCTRTISGRVTFGDVVYDGSSLLTQDGALALTLLGDAIEVSTPYTRGTLKKTESVPSVCQDFFSKHK